MEKYEKKLTNIWKTFDPNKPEKELLEFIREHHLSVMYMEGVVDNLIDRLNQEIRF